MSEGEAFVIASIFLIIGGIFLHMGFSKTKTYMAIKNTPTEAVQSLSMGRTELEGTVHKNSEPINPLLDAETDEGTDKQPVYCSWEISERVRNSKGRRRWRTRMDETESGRLFVTDGTGVVEVDISKLDKATIMDSENKYEKTYSAGEPFEDDILNQLQPYMDDDLFNSDNKVTRTKNRRKIKQEVLSIGDDCYVIGEAIERDSGTVDNLGTINQDSAVITEDTETGLFVVSDGGEDETTDWYRNMGIIGFVLGLICVLIAIEIIAPYVGWSTIFNYLNPLF